MNSELYVLNHNYGYGQEIELKELNRINLRNIEDLKTYLQDLLELELCENEQIISIYKTVKLRLRWEEYFKFSIH